MYHMIPGSFVANQARDSAYKRLALKLSPEVTIRMLSLLATADRCARNPARTGPLEHHMSEVDSFAQRARALGVFDGPEKAILTGCDLITLIPQGALLGRVLKRAYDIQIDEGIVDKAILKKRVIKEFLHEVFNIKP